jgi:hypothetical protein
MSCFQIEKGEPGTVFWADSDLSNFEVWISGNARSIS